MIVLKINLNKIVHRYFCFHLFIFLKKLKMKDCNCEARKYAAQSIDINEIKNEILNKSFKLEENYQPEVLIPELPFDITPMYNSQRLNYKIMKSLSFNSNKYLNCKWVKHQEVLPPAVRKIKLPENNDFEFRSSKLRLRDVSHPIRKIITGQMIRERGEYLPVPTDPLIGSKDLKKNGFLKRKSKPFQGLKK